MFRYDVFLSEIKILAGHFQSLNTITQKYDIISRIVIMIQARQEYSGTILWLLSTF